MRRVYRCLWDDYFRPKYSCRDPRITLDKALASGGWGKSLFVRIFRLPCHLKITFLSSAPAVFTTYRHQDQAIQEGMFLSICQICYDISNI